MMTAAECLEKFHDFLTYEKKSSVHTVSAYHHDILQFLAFAKSAYDVQEMGEVNHRVIRAWQMEMMEEGITPRSVNRKITALKTFYRYLLKMGWVAASPMNKVQSPKASKKLPTFVEEASINQWIDRDPFEDTFEGSRDKLLFLLLYHCGMRRSELIGLLEQDIDFHRGLLKVLGKRNKERYLPILKELAEQINIYLNYKKLNNYDSKYLLVGNQGEKLSVTFVYRKVKHLLKQFTTLEKCSPHVLRHTFATHLLNHGAELNSIKELLGHANLSATQVYTHNSFERLKNIHKQAHPKST
jgi:integrase/recombinase XerC